MEEVPQFCRTASVVDPILAEKLPQCNVCLSYFFPADTRRLGCGHVFCLRCLVTLVSHSAESCPTCRQTLDGLEKCQLTSAVQALKTNFNCANCDTSGVESDMRWCESCALTLCQKCSLHADHHTHALKRFSFNAVLIAFRDYIKQRDVEHNLFIEEQHQRIAMLRKQFETTLLPEILKLFEQNVLSKMDRFEKNAKENLKYSMQYRDECCREIDKLMRSLFPLEAGVVSTAAPSRQKSTPDASLLNFDEIQPYRQRLSSITSSKLSGTGAVIKSDYEAKKALMNLLPFDSSPFINFILPALEKNDETKRTISVQRIQSKLPEFCKSLTQDFLRTAADLIFNPDWNYFDYDDQNENVETTEEPEPTSEEVPIEAERVHTDAADETTETPAIDADSSTEDPSLDPRRHQFSFFDREWVRDEEFVGLEVSDMVVIKERDDDILLMLKNKGILQFDKELKMQKLIYNEKSCQSAAVFNSKLGSQLIVKTTDGFCVVFSTEHPDYPVLSQFVLPATVSNAHVLRITPPNDATNEQLPLMVYFLTSSFLFQLPVENLNQHIGNEVQQIDNNQIEMFFKNSLNYLLHCFCVSTDSKIFICVSERSDEPEDESSMTAKYLVLSSKNAELLIEIKEDGEHLWRVSSMSIDEFGFLLMVEVNSVVFFDAKNPKFLSWFSYSHYQNKNDSHLVLLGDGLVYIYDSPKGFMKCCYKKNQTDGPSLQQFEPGEKPSTSTAAH